MQVPRSSKEISEDNDYILYRVILFRRVADTFKAACRQAGYQVLSRIPHFHQYSTPLGMAVWSTAALGRQLASSDRMTGGVRLATAVLLIEAVWPTTRCTVGALRTAFRIP